MAGWPETVQIRELPGEHQAGRPHLLASTRSSHHRIMIPRDASERLLNEIAVTLGAGEVPRQPTAAAVPVGVPRERLSAMATTLAQLGAAGVVLQIAI